MKKSLEVPATLIVTLAAAMAGSGCGSTYSECQDAFGRPLPDSACSIGSVSGGHWVTIQRGGFGGSGGSFGG